jgi:hypothetical protein
MAPFAPGSALGLGWHVHSFGAVDRGAAVLTLMNQDGGVARVHICAHEGQPRGLAHTRLLDLILMDGGDGARATDETVGRVLLGLAAKMGDNELEPSGDLHPLACMMTHGDRVVHFGPETLT